MSGSDDGYEENKTDSRHRKEEVSLIIYMQWSGMASLRMEHLDKDLNNWK